ncbi:hypothetical protein Pcinc_017707, partial [Petrolisthes cinctipes]
VGRDDEFKFHHNALETFTSIRITTVDKVNQREEIEVDVQDVLERGPSGGRRVVVLEAATRRVSQTGVQKPYSKDLARAGADVLFMIDAYDERYMAYQDAFKELLRKCPEATFLVVTRPHRTQFILRACEEPVRVLTAHGFGRQEAVEYATKLLKMHDKEGRSGGLH